MSMAENCQECAEGCQTRYRKSQEKSAFKGYSSLRREGDDSLVGEMIQLGCATLVFGKKGRGEFGFEIVDVAEILDRV